MGERPEALSRTGALAWPRLSSCRCSTAA